jgi:hypothetical protein
MRTLAEFDPHLAGTPPLGVDLPTSDLDILCHAAEPEAFAVALWAAFSGETEFLLRQWIIVDRPVIASFIAHGWPFQVFGQKKPVKEQNGWRHFIAERRLLRLGGPTFRAAIMRERSRGVKQRPSESSPRASRFRGPFAFHRPQPTLTSRSARYQTSDFIH